LWYANDGEGLLHIGGSLRQATGIRVSGEPGRFQVFRTRDAIRTGLAGGWPIPAAIVLEGDDMQWANAELAMVHGPWTLQSEYLVSGYQDARRTLNDPVVGNVTYHGGYIQLLYFLTGEHDNYNKQTGVFERVTPHENFFAVADGCGRRSWGLGAWQTGLRYNYLDLNDEGLNGGQLYNLTYGLNWFWNPNAKWQFNYMYTYRDVSEVGEGNGSGWINGYGMRFAFDF
jgi:phosphate-selective porin OprO/OprP